MNRFPTTVETHEEARAYYQNRAIQLLGLGWELQALVDLPWGVEATLIAPNGTWHRSVFVLEGHTRQGHLTRWFKSNQAPFVTSDMCPKMQSYLDRHGIAYTNIEEPSASYLAIERYYGDRQSKRGGQFYMNHIDEGLYILDEQGASAEVKDAWCLHPIVQDDEDLRRAVGEGWLSDSSPVAVALAMEYRHQANSHLSKHPPATPSYGPLGDVRLMLYADKVQNRKDFEVYLRGRPDVKNSDRLDDYFQEWFQALGITEEHYFQLVGNLANRTLRPIEVLWEGRFARARLGTG